MADWTPIEITDEGVEGEPTPDRVVLVFHLSSEPDHRWRGFFERTPWQTSAGRPGSTLDRPRVLGSTIRAVVAPTVRDETTRWVRSAVGEANRQYQAIEPPQ